MTDEEKIQAKRKWKNFELRISYGGDMAVEYELDRK